MSEEASVPSVEQAVMRGALNQKATLHSQTKVFVGGHIKAFLLTQGISVQLIEATTKVVQVEGFANNGTHHEWELSDLVSLAVEAEQRYAQAIELLEATPSTEPYNAVWVKLVELSLFI